MVHGTSSIKSENSLKLTLNSKTKIDQFLELVVLALFVCLFVCLFLFPFCFVLFHFFNTNYEILTFL